MPDHHTLALFLAPQGVTYQKSAGIGLGGTPLGATQDTTDPHHEDTYITLQKVFYIQYEISQAACADLSKGE